MRVFRSLEEARGVFGPCAVTIGNFDGVHIGHQALVRRVAGLGKEMGVAAGVLTFDPHPTKVVAPERAPRLMSTVEERCAWLGAAGAERILILPFTREVAGLGAEAFVREILVEAMGARAVVVGENFRFGHKQAGNVGTLRELGGRYGFEAVAMEGVKWRGIGVSSSEVRKRIESGDVARAGRMLGRWFALEGEVVKGQGIGRKQTVPTLNLEGKGEVLPGVGVYVTRTAEVGGAGRRWASVTNVGYRPTFGGEGLTVETYLLSELAGETPERIRVEFVRWVRGEMKFGSGEELRGQILADVKRAEGWHRRAGRVQGEARG